MNSEELRQALQREVSKHGVSMVAREIPAGRDTVYRILRGDTVKPTLAVQSGIERMAKRHER